MRARILTEITALPNTSPMGLHKQTVAKWSVDGEGLEVSRRAFELLKDGADPDEALEQACKENEEDQDDLQFMKDRYLLAATRAVHSHGLVGLSRRELAEVAALNPVPVIPFHKWLDRMDNA
jgi:hypothetical protein